MKNKYKIMVGIIIIIMVWVICLGVLLRNIFVIGLGIIGGYIDIFLALPLLENYLGE